MNKASPENQYRILVIDDNAAIHDDFRKILRASARDQNNLDHLTSELFGETAESEQALTFEINSAFQGHEGLAMIEHALQQGRPYAMAFVDVRMPPGWDGIETVSRIWRSYPDLEVVICTAYTDYTLDEILSKLGHSDQLLILKKPFDNIEALQLANALTKKWVLGQESKLRLSQLDQMVAERTLQLQAANKKLIKEILEREEAEAALRASEERFAKAFRASPIPMAIQGLEDQRYLDVNETFVQLTGYARGELLGHNAADLNLVVDQAKRNLLLERLKESKSVRNVESQIRVKSGSVRQTLISAEVLNLNDALFALVLIQDVTDRINLETQLRQAQKMEAIGQLASGVAHDFNNILTAILGHAELVLARQGLVEDIQSSMKEVANAAERAAGLTRQLLAFSRKQVIQSKVLDLNETVRRMENMLQRLIGEHIKITFDCPGPLRPVFADPCNIEQILMNLALNARDAMPEGGTLAISTTEVHIDTAATHPEAQPGDYARLSITDTGCGMTPEVMSRIFEPFFTTKDVGKGTGLGLATVYGIVKQHGGWVEVFSEVAKGSRFDVYIPCTQHSAAGSVRRDSDRQAQAGHETILLVEDEAPLRHLTTLILKKCGYTVIDAASGAEALRIWPEYSDKVDLLLTDMVMPDGVSGRQLADKLRAQKPSLRVIYSSGYSIDLADDEFAHSQSLRLLQKPYAPLQLMRTVRNCLDEDIASAQPGPGCRKKDSSVKIVASLTNKGSVPVFARC